MNFVNRSSVGGRMKSRVGASERVKASLLPVSDVLGALASSSSSPGILVERLTQELCWMLRDLGVIAKDGSLNVIFLNGLADLLGIELLEL